jgi:uncharacterized protein
MPANLPPPYIAAEERYRQGREPAEKMAILQEMWTLLPKHKGTDKLQAELKAKMSKLRKTPGSRGGGARKPEFHVERSGAGQFFLIGPPGAGRSSLMRALTSAEPEVSEGMFTTKKPVPGMMRFEDVAVQLIEAPPLFPSMTPKWLYPNLRIGDGLILVFSLGNDEVLERWDEVKEDIARAKVVLHPPDEEPPDSDDPGIEPLPAWILMNKADLDEDGVIEEIFRDYVDWDLPMLRVSATTGEGLEAFPRQVWDSLQMLRVYTKLPGKPPDLKAPFVLPRGRHVIDLTERIHKDLVPRFEFARLWRGERYTGARVSGEFELLDGDVVEVHA